MKKYIYFLFALLLIVACHKGDDYKGLDCSTINAKYSANIFPIINRNCNASGCHNAGSGNGDFTTYAGLKVKADNGTLSDRVLYKKDMPVSAALSLDNRNILKCWLDNGAQNN
jgi:hypothetical protein